MLNDKSIPPDTDKKHTCHPNLTAFAAALISVSEPTLDSADPNREKARGGSVPMNPLVERQPVEAFRKPAPAGVAPKDEPLTRREEEVLATLAKGCATKEIADQLHISFDTVRFHLKNIYHKLHVRSRTEALLKWLR